VDVTFALIARPTRLSDDYERRGLTEASRRFLLASWKPPDLTRPYGDLRKATLSVSEDEPASAVLTRAVSEFADVASCIDGSPWIGFRLYEPALEKGFSREERQSDWERVPFVDGGGRVWWRRFDNLDLPYLWIAHAARTGVLAGDAYRPYLLLRGWGGSRWGLPPVSFDELREMYRGLQPWLDGIASMGGTAAVAAWLGRGLKRLAAGLGTIDRHGRDLEQRGLIPDDVFMLLTKLKHSGATRVDLVQALLGCSMEEAALIVRLTPTSDSEARTGDPDRDADIIAAELRELLWNNRDSSPAAGVARALSEAPDTLEEFLPPEAPSQS
jgi:hypothetical protein